MQYTFNKSEKKDVVEKEGEAILRLIQSFKHWIVFF
jgi:hypothetical protein